MSNMTPEQLAEWRAKRTGKPMAELLGNPPSNAGLDPDAPRIIRSPAGNMPVPDFMQDPDMGTPAPAANPQPAANPELEELRQQLAAAHGRLGPTQRQLDEMRATLDAMQKQNAQLQATLEDQQRVSAATRTKQQAADFDPFEGLSKDQIDLLDPAAAEMIRQAARNAYAKAASQTKDPEEIIRKTLAERDALALRKFVQATAASTGLTKLATDPRFEKFVAEDDSATLLLNSFMQAADIEIAQALEPNLRRLIKRFEKTTDSTRNPDPQDQLASHLARAPGAAPAGASRQAASAEDVKTISAKARALARAGKHKEANQLLASINN